MALSCHDIDELIERGVEGMLAPREEQRLQRHLAGCDRCRRRYRLECRAMNGLNALPRPEPPADMPERVLAALPPVSPRTLGRLADLLRRAALDPDLRRRLREAPRATLLAERIALPPGVRVEVVSEQPAPLPTSEVLCLPLPEVALELEEVEERLAAMGLGALFGFWW